MPFQGDFPGHCLGRAEHCMSSKLRPRGYLIFLGNSGWINRMSPIETLRGIKHMFLPPLPKPARIKWNYWTEYVSPYSQFQYQPGTHGSPTASIPNKFCCFKKSVTTPKPGKSIPITSLSLAKSSMMKSQECMLPPKPCTNSKVCLFPFFKIYFQRNDD